MSAGVAAPRRAHMPRALPRHELVGTPGAPVVVVLGGISASAHVTATASDPAPGWWDAVVGPGRAIDTRRFRVLGIDWFDAPGDGVHEAVTTHAQAAALARLLEELGVTRARMVIGASYGGMVALALAEQHAALAEQLVVISAAHESHPMSTGLRALQRRIVALGLETGRTREALAIARAVAMTTYRTAGELAARFAPVLPERGEQGITFAVERYLMHHGERFADRFDTRRFLALSLSTDLHRVEPERITVPTLLVAADGDTLVPGGQMQELERRIAARCRLVPLATHVGHDAFLAEPEKIGRILTAALEHGAVA